MCACVSIRRWLVTLHREFNNGCYLQAPPVGLNTVELLKTASTSLGLSPLRCERPARWLPPKSHPEAGRGFWVGTPLGALANFSGALLSVNPPCLPTAEPSTPPIPTLPYSPTYHAPHGWPLPSTLSGAWRLQRLCTLQGIYPTPAQSPRATIPASMWGKCVRSTAHTPYGAVLPPASSPRHPEALFGLLPGARTLATTHQ